MSYTELLNCSDSRSFLRKALELQFSPQKVNLADFGRRADFSSRSFVHEFLSGKKGLSKDSFYKIKATLKLPKDFIRLFEILVLLDFPKLQKKSQTQEYLLSLRQKLVINLKQKPNEAKATAREPDEDWIELRNSFRVYASLGEVDRGKTLVEIARMSSLSEKKALQVIDLLIANNLVSKEDDRYRPLHTQSDFFGLRGRKLASLVQTICTEIKNKAEQMSTNDQNLLVHTAFSLHKDRQYEFNRRLREAVMNVVDDFQDDSGDLVKEVFIAGF